MTSLTPQQAQALWDAGGFIVCPNLPEGSEYGLDGITHAVTARFNGTKFVPPGPHLITWSPGSSSRSPRSDVASPHAGLGPGAIPIRAAIFRYFPPRHRLVLHYDSHSESLVPEENSLISDDHLRALDPGLAPYDFNALDTWKALSSRIDQVVLRDVLGEEGRVDGMTAVLGEEEDEARGGRATRPSLSTVQGDVVGGQGMSFARINLRRSFRDGAVGDEVTRFSRDKSWLLGDVISSQLSGNASRLIAQFQLAFILLLHLSNYSALQVYKRILPLLTRSASIHVESLSFPHIKDEIVTTLYLDLMQTLAVQLESLPQDAFELELPELDVWYIDELGQLRGNLAASLRVDGVWRKRKEELSAAWRTLRQTAGRRFGWDIHDLSIAHLDDGPSQGADNNDEDVSEEEGEYAPVIVEM